MPLQNRVTPFSGIEVHPARGLFTGNRGILHNEQQQLVSTKWRHNAWIVCELEYKGWRRQLMQPGRWTELFFLDEATAFAAGHRPCAFCRRTAYKQFLALSGLTSAPLLDQALHAQRTRQQSLVELGTLPAHALFAIGETAYLNLGKYVLRWSHSGYGAPETIPAETQVVPLTPKLTQQVLAAGYPPRLHPTASLC